MVYIKCINIFGGSSKGGVHGKHQVYMQINSASSFQGWIRRILKICQNFREFRLEGLLCIAVNPSFV